MLVRKIKTKLSKVSSDVFGMELLRSLTGSFVVPPLFTASALRPICLAMIINDLVINNRRVVLELGSGITTLYLAKAMKTYGIDGHIYSVDENKDWLKYIQSQLEKEGIDYMVTLIEAPAEQYEEGRWYSLEDLNEKVPKDLKIDSLVIDGPTAYGAGQGGNRYLGFPYFSKFLNERCFIYLDDTDRQGETLILKKWEEEYKISFKQVYGTGSFCVKGDHFNFLPL